jgi:tetratricopeptide (TPR) repeat protein
VLALDALALCAQYLDLHEEQEQAAREMVQVAIDRQDKWMEAYSLFQLSAARIQQRDYLGAREYADRGLQLSEEIGDSFVSLYQLSILGAAARNLGEFEQARDHYLGALHRSERLGYRWGIENASKYLGHIALAQAETDEAEDHLYRSLRIAEEIGLRRDLLNLLVDFARVRVAQNRQGEAIEMLALVIGHAASAQARFGEGPIREAAQLLLEELSEAVPPGAYSAAVERGKGRDLDEAVGALIREEEAAGRRLRISNSA